MGTPKAELMLGGVRLVDRAVGILKSGGCAEVLVVAADGGLSAPLADEIVVNEEAASGMGSSLRCGLIAAERRGAEGVVIVLVDQPLIDPVAVSMVVDAAVGSGGAAQASYGGRRGHPVVIPASHFAHAAEAAVGDQGARRFLEEWSQSGELAVVEVPGDPRDLDVPADIAVIEALLGE